MREEQYEQKMFDLLFKRIDGLDSDIRELKDSVNKLASGLNQYATKADTSELEGRVRVLENRWNIVGTDKKWLMAIVATVVSVFWFLADKLWDKLF